MLDNPLLPVREFRRLPDTITQQSTLAPVQSGNQLARPASAHNIVPLPGVGMPNNTTPTKIANANPRRVSIIIRGRYDTFQVLIGGPAGDLPNGDLTSPKGLRVVGQEAITLDTTGEIWGAGLSPGPFGQYFDIIELVAPVAQAGT